MQSAFAVTAIALAAAIGLSGCASGAVTSASRSTGASEAVSPSPKPSLTPVSHCASGMLAQEEASIHKLLPGVNVSLGTVADVQPVSLRPLLSDACMYKWTAPKTGNLFTDIFSTTVTQDQIATASHSAGYSGDMTLISTYALPISGKEPATVTVSPTDNMVAFSKYYPSVLEIVIGYPPAG